MHQDTTYSLKLNVNFPKLYLVFILTCCGFYCVLDVLCSHMPAIFDCTVCLFVYVGPVQWTDCTADVLTFVGAEKTKVDVITVIMAQVQFQ